RPPASAAPSLHDALPIYGLVRPVGLALGPVGLGDVVGDVGGERRLAHRRAPGEDDEVRRLQAAHLVVEIREPGGQTREMPVTLVDRKSTRLNSSHVKISY